MKLKKITALVLATTMVASIALTGCGSSDSASNGATGNATYTTIGTMDGKDIDYKLAYYMAKLQQVNYDGYYRSSYGADMWSQDISGDGTTMEESVKGGILDALETYLVMEKNMDKYGVTISADEQKKITKAAESFLKDNSEEANKALGASQEVVERYLYLYTVSNKVYNKIVSEADVTVTDKEAAMKTFTYVKISKGGATDENGEYVEPEPATAAKTKAQADTFVKEAATDFDKACKDGSLSATSYSYSANDPDSDTEMEVNVIKAAEKLKVGEISDIIETQTDYYIIRMDNLNDKKAAKTKREELVSKKKSDYYNDVIESLKKEVKFQIIDAAWGSIRFTDTFGVISNKKTTTGSDTTGN